MATLPLFLARYSHSSSHWSWQGVVIVIAIIVVWVAIGFYLEKRRAEALRKVAEDLRLTYSGTAGLAHAEISSLHLGSQGHGVEIKNVMSGRAGETEVTIFDYEYTTGHGKNSTTHGQTVVRFRTADWQLPLFELRPEGLFSKLGAALGGQDIDFVSHPVFSKMFVLKSPSESDIRAFFTEALLSALERKKGISVEGHGSTLLFYRAGRKVNAKTIRALLEEAHGTYAHFADAVNSQGQMWRREVTPSLGTEA